MARPVPRATMRTIRYGSSPSQEGDLHLPGELRPPVVCLLHGGFWAMPYARDQMTAIAQDLAARGFAVWNLEYRRLGETGGGWPGTLADVAAGLDHLATLAAGGVELDLERLTVAGHSAGGHLALWSAARKRPHGDVVWRSRVRPAAAAGLAPLADLGAAHAMHAGNGAVGELLGGSPAARPERYAAASPLALLPLEVPQLVVHGSADRILPPELSRAYARAAVAAGDRVEMVELEGAGHMDYLDPQSPAHATLCRWLAALSDKGEQGRPRP